MSTGSDTGGEDRRNEPTLATVWRLHVGDEEDSSTAEEWYENERLSGHITGGAPRVAPTDRSAPAQENGPAILDWRYEPLTPPPGVRQRLNEALGRRFGRGRPLRSGSEEPRQPSDPVVDQDAETEVTEPAAEQDIVPRAAEAATDAEPAISLRGDTSVPSGDAPRRRTAILALCLVAVVAAAVAAPILLSGNRTHSASRAAADTGSAVRSNPLLSIAPHIAPTRTGSRKAKVTETPPHRAKRKAQRSRRRASAVRRRHSAAHATSTVAHASIHTTSTPATAVTSPTATTPTGASTSPTGGSSSPSPTSSAGSSSSSGTHSSSAAKQPAFGATGALGPGSSPDG